MVWDRRTFEDLESRYRFSLMATAKRKLALYRNSRETMIRQIHT